MNTQSQFDVSRIMKLIANDLCAHSKQIRIAALTILIYWTLSPFSVIDSSTQYFITLFFSGFILTALSLREFHEPHLAYHYLTLPCSNPERFLSKWALTAVVYPLALLALFYCFSLFGMFIKLLAHLQLTLLYSPFHSSLWMGIGVYMVLHSIVFMGAVIFKRHSLLKTTLMLGCFMLAISSFIGTLGVKYFPLWFEAISQNTTLVEKFGLFLFWIVVPLFFWTVTYLRMTECEIR